MFINSLVEYTRKKDLMREKSSYDRRVTYDSLGFFDKKIFARNQDLIYKIVDKIESSTGWEYTTHGFVCPSSFTYVGGDIRFHVNEVSSDFDGYSYQEGMNDRELAFLSQNQALLKRLHALEQKRDSYISKCTDQSSVVYMDQYRSKKKRNLDDIYLSSWLEGEASQFVRTYGIHGVDRLLSLLNEIADTTSLDELYSSFQDNELSREYKKQLLRWASAYSKRGNVLLERFNKDQERLKKLDSFPDSFMHDESEFILRYK